MMQLYNQPLSALSKRQASAGCCSRAQQGSSSSAHGLPVLPTSLIATSIPSVRHGPVRRLPHGLPAFSTAAELSQKTDLPPSEGAKFLAEFTAQALFNYLSITTAATATFMAAGSALQSTMLVVGSHAVILTLLVYIFSSTSGAHFNPVITLSMVLSGKQSVNSGLGYLAAQLAGGALGAFLAYFCLPSNMQAAAMAGLAAVPAGRSIAQALVGEIVGSFLFISSLFGLLVDPRGWGKWGGLSVPLSICLLFIIIGPISGNCLNPARAFGPALITGHWEQHWIYWLAPLLGGGSAGLLYSNFFSPLS